MAKRAKKSPMVIASVVLIVLIAFLSSLLLIPQSVYTEPSPSLLYTPFYSSLECAKSNIDAHSTFNVYTPAMIASSAASFTQHSFYCGENSVGDESLKGTFDPINGCKYTLTGTGFYRVCSKSDPCIIDKNLIFTPAASRIGNPSTADSVIHRTVNEGTVTVPIGNDQKLTVAAATSTNQGITVKVDGVATPYVLRFTELGKISLTTAQAGCDASKLQTVATRSALEQLAGQSVVQTIDWTKVDKLSPGQVQSDIVVGYVPVLNPTNWIKSDGVYLTTQQVGSTTTIRACPVKNAGNVNYVTTDNCPTTTAYECLPSLPAGQGWYCVDGHKISQVKSGGNCRASMNYISPDGTQQCSIACNKALNEETGTFGNPECGKIETGNIMKLNSTTTECPSGTRYVKKTTSYPDCSSWTCSLGIVSPTYIPVTEDSCQPVGMDPTTIIIIVIAVLVVMVMLMMVYSQRKQPNPQVM